MFRKLLIILIIFSLSLMPAVGLAQSGEEVTDNLDEVNRSFTISDILDKASELLNSLRDVVALGTGALESLKSAWNGLNSWMMANLGTSINEVVSIFVAAFMGLIDLFVRVFGSVLAV